MIIANDNNTGKRYKLTEDQERVLNYMRESFETLSKSMSAGEATTQAYLMNLASNDFMSRIKSTNDNKSIPELLNLEEYMEELSE